MGNNPYVRFKKQILTTNDNPTKVPEKIGLSTSPKPRSIQRYTIYQPIKQLTMSQEKYGVYPRLFLFSILWTLTKDKQRRVNSSYAHNSQFKLSVDFKLVGEKWVISNYREMYWFL